MQLSVLCGSDSGMDYVGLIGAAVSWIKFILYGT